jgi:flagellar motility protein MotE (MotC chaperone)
MNITGMDIAAVATLVGSIGTAATAVVKAVHAVRKAEAADARAIAIELQREQAKKERDREIENLKSEVKVLQHENKEVRERLSEGNGHFVRLEVEVKETNGLLREIIGALRNKGLVISETHKVARDAGLEL